MSNQYTGKRIIAAGAISMLLAVAAGAFGAHGLKPYLAADMLTVYHTAVDYQFYHSLGLMLCGLLARNDNHLRLRLSAWLMLIGMVIFCGSLYVLSMTGLRWLGAITPLGGVCFLLAWAVLGWHMLRR
ncbi:MAG: DUF423 domain-containing protein [Gammaproteobacteria bacterium]